MRLQRIIANRLSRLEGWTYATVGGNSSNFASQLYFFNAWAPLLWPVACEMESSLSLSLNWEHGSDRSIDGQTLEPKTVREYRVTTVWNMKWIQHRKSSEDLSLTSRLSPVTCHLSSPCSLLILICLVPGVWTVAERVCYPPLIILITALSFRNRRWPSTA